MADRHGVRSVSRFRTLSAFQHRLRVQQRAFGDFQRGRARPVVRFRAVGRHSHRQRARRY